MLPSSTDVLVVGAGPAGLACAISLRQQGFDVVVVDALEEGLNSSRAVVVHAYTLEMLETISVADRLVKAGIQARHTTTRLGPKPMIRFNFDCLDSRYQYALVIGQNETEAILVERLQELGGTVHRPKKVVGLSKQHEPIKEVLLDSGEIIKAKYIVGADGIHSTVRGLVGLRYFDPHNPDATDDDAIIQLALADITYKSSTMPKDELVAIVSPHGIVIWAPLSNGHARLIVSVPDGQEIPKSLDAAWFQTLLHSRGIEDIEIEKAFWTSRARPRSRMAEKVFVPSSSSEGGVILIGDAAHSHSPAGGQGMNLSIVDGIKLGEAIRQHVDTKDDSVLREYEAIRKKWALEVIGLSEGLTRLSKLSYWQAYLALWFGWLVNVFPPTHRRFGRVLAGLHRR